jgi:hypothetical protein
MALNGESMDLFVTLATFSLRKGRGPESTERKEKQGESVAFLVSRG